MVVLNLVKEKSESKSQLVVTLKGEEAVVLNLVKEKSESKSQPKYIAKTFESVVLNLVKEKSESKSQLKSEFVQTKAGCFKSCQRKI